MKLTYDYVFCLDDWAHAEANLEATYTEYHRVWYRVLDCSQVKIKPNYIHEVTARIPTVVIPLSDD